MAQTFEEILEGRRHRLLTMLEECRFLVRLGDFRQAIPRFAEFRGEIEQDARIRAVAEETSKALAHRDSKAFIAKCEPLTVALEEHFEHQRKLALQRLGRHPASAELARVLRSLGAY